MNETQIDRIASLFPCFAGVPGDGWASAEIVTAGPGTPHAVREGRMLRHAMFMMSGAIRVYKISPAGREITLYRVRGGQCCVLMMASILGETEYEASVSVEADTDVLLLPVPLFRSWIDLYKPVRQYVYKQIVERMTNVTKLLEDIAFRPVPSRLAEYLLEASADPRLPSLPVTHEMLAIELGTAREVVSRILKDFATQGAIALGRGRITVTDRGILIAIAEHAV
ncbi:Crp/Fnr family transcriptional regulator [Paenibacillus arenilitoris]|uniref:Crp/Fnr family transcriptional regulator n=1 Tax=Paenibacillus arenilitoris TaxID=2772299 RepID=A0A927CNV4_9BACL|nr:Crp/Fnr family transcriptional regulator [Paenibacillus arenilitoris]MBD2870825.1 Crp/Fnr family transcriptional regulator [Paenibacillus arenilitoris]